MQPEKNAPLSEQYRRTELMLGHLGLERLRSSCVFVAGLGAVGSYVVEALARGGIRRFQLVDFDVIQASNINRQLFATHNTIGQLKTEAASARILSIVPDAEIETAPILINDASVDSLFTDRFSARPDFVVDAIDSLGSKVALIATVLRSRLPLISSMGAALRFDSGLARAGRLTDVTNDPLAAQLRKRLRRVGVNTDDVRCVFSPEPVRAALREGATFLERTEPARPLDASTIDSPPGRPRNTLGSLPTIVGLFGLMIAHEILLALAKEE